MKRVLMIMVAAYSLVFLSSFALSLSGNIDFETRVTPSFTNYTQQALLVGEETKPFGQGASVALSADGSTLAVGGVDSGGSVWIFQRFNNGLWFDQQRLLPPGESSQYGISVSLSADGYTLAVGQAGGGNVDMPQAVYIYGNVEGVWQQQQVLNATGTTGYTGFGTSVSLSAFNDTLAVGAPEDNFMGAVWIFTKVGSLWSKQEKIVGDGEEAEFGNSVLLSSDGNTLAVGAIGGIGNSGAVFIFTRSDGQWKQEAKIVISNSTPRDLFGSSLAFSGDSNLIAIGAPYANETLGALWTFENVNGQWVNQQKIVPSDFLVAPGFGFSAALNTAGTLLAVGGPFDNKNKGALWIFNHTSNGWQEAQKIVPMDVTELPNFGFSTAFSSDGSLVVTGGPLHNFTSTGPLGATWVFENVS